MTLINLLEEFLCSAGQNLEERGPNDFPPLTKLSLDLEVQILSFDLVLLLGLGIVENLNHSVYLPLEFCIANRQHISNKVGHDNNTPNESNHFPKSWPSSHDVNSVPSHTYSSLDIGILVHISANPWFTKIELKKVCLCFLEQFPLLVHDSLCDSACHLIFVVVVKFEMFYDRELPHWDQAQVFLIKLL